MAIFVPTPHNVSLLFLSGFLHNYLFSRFRATCPKRFSLQVQIPLSVPGSSNVFLKRDALFLEQFDLKPKNCKFSMVFQRIIIIEFHSYTSVISLPTRLMKLFKVLMASFMLLHHSILKLQIQKKI